MKSSPEIGLLPGYGPEVGFGHWSRVHILADQLRRLGAKVCLIQRQEFLPAPSILPVLKIQSASELSHLNALIVDDHGVTPDWLQELSPHVFRIGIDETGPLREYFQLHFFTTLMGLFSKEVRTSLGLELHGLKWFIFPELPEAQKKRDAQTLLVSFGGTDPAGLTEKFLHGMAHRLPTQYQMKVVLGLGFEDSRRDNLRQRFSRGNLKWVESPASLLPLMQSVNLFVGSGGVSAFEALSCQALPVLMAQHEEQAGVIRGLEAHDLALDMGGWHTLRLEEFRHLLHQPQRLAILRRRALKCFDSLCPDPGSPIMAEKILQAV